jgi:hypothetical protein
MTVLLTILIFYIIYKVLDRKDKKRGYSVIVPGVCSPTTEVKIVPYPNSKTTPLSVEISLKKIENPDLCK